MCWQDGRRSGPWRTTSVKVDRPPSILCPTWSNAKSRVSQRRFGQTDIDNPSKVQFHREVIVEYLLPLSTGVPKGDPGDVLWSVSVTPSSERRRQ